MRQEEWESDPTVEVHLFDQAEGQGKIGLQPGAYGLWIFVPGFAEPVALIDLFYLSKEGGSVPDRGGHPQIVIHDTVREEVVARALFTQERTVVDFETGVKPLTLVPGRLGTFGYEI